MLCWSLNFLKQTCSFRTVSEFVTALLLFDVLVFWPWGLWDLGSLPRGSHLHLLQWRAKSQALDCGSSISPGRGGLGGSQPWWHIKITRGLWKVPRPKQHPWRSQQNLWGRGGGEVWPGVSILKALGWLEHGWGENGWGGVHLPFICKEMGLPPNGQGCDSLWAMATPSPREYWPLWFTSLPYLWSCLSALAFLGVDIKFINFFCKEPIIELKHQRTNLEPVPVSCK